MNWYEFIKDTETVQVPRIKASRVGFASRRVIEGRSSSTLLAMIK